MRRLLLIFLLLFSVSHIHAAELPEYGLQINTFPEPQSKWTQLVLNNGEPVHTKGQELTLSFQVYLREENLIGTVFRIITSDGGNIDLLYGVDDDNIRYPILVAGDDVYPLSKNIKLKQWVDVSISIHPKDGGIVFTYDDDSIQVRSETARNMTGARISFGYCPFEGFSQGDISSVNIRDVLVRRKDKLIHHWKLALHNGQNCFDELSGAVAKCVNASWIIDKYISWVPVYHEVFDNIPSIAFDPDTETFYVAKDKKQLFLFNPKERRRTVIENKGGEFMATFPNQLIYIPQHSQLLSYNLDDNLFSFYDIGTSTWSSNARPQSEHDFWNNTISFYPEENALISFGGYGHYRYNNTLLISYPYSPQKALEKHILDAISPRYSAASVIVGSSMYIFGGRGNHSGRQELSQRNFYDLYELNLQTKELSLLWEQDECSSDIGDFFSGGNMIYDEEKDCFYALAKVNGGTLVSIHRTEPVIETMSLPTMSADGHYLHVDLFYSPSQTKLYSAIVSSQVNNITDVTIFELPYPPIPVKSLEQVSREEPSSDNGIFYLLASLCSVLALGTFFYSRYRKRRRESTHGEEAPTASLVSNERYYYLNKSAICFFGGFKVFDKNGNNISNRFSHTLKHLLIMIILHTGKNAKGISGNKIISLLWRDKNEESAKNIRNVYISKLRGLLDEVGGFHIVSQNGYLSIESDEGSICDYLEALSLYAQNEDSAISRLSELLLNGMMLPDIEEDWIDGFKSDFSSSTIDLLGGLLQRKGLSDDFRLKIVDTLFQHDFLNEEAIAVKCRILYRQGKIGLAKAAYDRFCKDYSASMGSECPLRFNKLID